MNSVVHFELPADDCARAEEFYKQVFGWGINPVLGIGYSLVQTTPVNEQHAPIKPGAINGGMLTRQEPIMNPVITINVPDIDVALDAVQEHGGVVVREKKPVGDMGFAAYFKDSEGNVLGLWQNVKKE